MYKILAIDDDEGFLTSIGNNLEYNNYDVTLCSNPLNVNDLIDDQNFNAVLCDVKMPGMDGIEVLKIIQEKDPFLPVIMLSGQSTISIAIDAIRSGAYDFLEKPVTSEKLIKTIEKAIKKNEWVFEKKILLNERESVWKMIGNSPALLRALNVLEKVAPTEAKVLILGETGTGKELAARAIHNLSKRSLKPYIKINCAAIPENLLESELFGHKKGSFTGASQDKTGKFKAADGGTLFLDEIGDLSLNLQAKMLRVLNDNEIEVIGDVQPQKIDVRIIAATNKNLEEMVEEGTFRSDLLHRIKVISIQLPPQRDRIEDIPLLARNFLLQNAQSYNKQLLDFSPQALLLLQKKEWPGNVRELKNVIEKITIFATGPIIQASDIQQAIKFDQLLSVQNQPDTSLKEATEQLEKEIIISTLNNTNWKMQQTADILNIDRTTLFKKMQKYAIQHDE